MLKRVFQIVSCEGETYFVTAESFAEAVDKFKTWERDQTGEEDMDDPQSVADVGFLIEPVKAPAL